MRDFNHSVGVLVQAYLNNTLIHSNCYACAVGNLIAHANGFTYQELQDPKMDNDHYRLKWDAMPSCYSKAHPGGACEQDGNWMRVFSNGQIREHKYNGMTKRLIDSTGYTIRELAEIEKCFECAEFGESPEEYMFNGLMSVVDVLAEIHGIDLTQREEAKLLFLKA